MKWIDAKKRKPDAGIQVLISVNGCIRIGYMMRRSWYLLTGPVWKFDAPTHWMPLPKPPKKGSK